MYRSPKRQITFGNKHLLLRRPIWRQANQPVTKLCRNRRQLFRAGRSSIAARSSPLEHARCVGNSPAELVINGLSPIGSPHNSQRSSLEFALTSAGFHACVGPRRVRHSKPLAGAAAVAAIIKSSRPMPLSGLRVLCENFVFLAVQGVIERRPDT